MGQACSAPILEAPRVEAAVEEALRLVEANPLPLPAELVRLQFRAVEATREFVLAALRLARAVNEATGADALAFYPSATAAPAALHLFQSALERIGAAAISSFAPSSSRSAPPPSGVEREKFLDAYASLTKQQKFVLALMCEGLSNKMIAYKLGICESTVKAHVSRVLHSLRTPSRARALALMARYGEAGPISLPREL
jgi:DNA-binding NarL/FixJ family response regulator